MELIRQLYNPKVSSQGCIATIGNFDGMHLGHQAVIRQLKRYAAKKELPTVVMTFEPQPLEFFSPTSAPGRLTGFREKHEYLRLTGIDRFVCLRFQESLASLSAEQFVRHLLVDGLAVNCIVVGDDFRFGKDREGDFQLLQRLGEHLKFDVMSTETYIIEGARISSSRIRTALMEGRLHEAELLLGRPYSMSGKVMHGDKRGRELGFPTANIAINRCKPPLLGIFAVRVFGLEQQVYDAVANIGTRPVFDGLQLLLEVHLLDYDKEIYGQRLTVEFMKRLRSEKKFTSVQHLRDQIQQDSDDARSYFNENE